MATWKPVGTTSVKIGSKHVTMRVARHGRDAKVTFPPTGISLTVDPRKKTLLNIREGHGTKKEVHDALVAVNRMVGGESMRANPTNPERERESPSRYLRRQNLMRGIHRRTYYWLKSVGLWKEIGGGATGIVDGRKDKIELIIEGIDAEGRRFIKSNEGIRSLHDVGLKFHFRPDGSARVTTEGAPRKNPAKFDRCVREVTASAKKSGYPLRSAYAVCNASMRKNPAITPGSPIADLQQDIMAWLHKNRLWTNKIRTRETSAGYLEVSGKTRDGDDISYFMWTSPRVYSAYGDENAVDLADRDRGMVEEIRDIAASHKFVLDTHGGSTLTFKPSRGKRRANPTRRLRKNP